MTATGAAGSGTNLFKVASAVIVGLALFSLLSEVLESTIVRATAPGPLSDMASYFAARNRPGVLGAKAVFNILVAVLAGYTTGRVAGEREMTFAGVVAALQTTAFAWGFTLGEFAAQTPLWMRGVLLLTTGPAMLAGAWVRAQARAAESGPVSPPNEVV